MIKKKFHQVDRSNNENHLEERIRPRLLLQSSLVQMYIYRCKLKIVENYYLSVL
jgi:hypothetical protein